MIVFVSFILIAFSAAFAAVTGNLSAVSGAILSGPRECVELMLGMGGSICLFSGLARVAEASGAVSRVSRVFSGVLGALIPKTRRDACAKEAVTMNLACNFFGLGNAATPYGLRAAQLLTGERLTRSAATFLILNTCSLQLIPTTVCAVREACGSADPLAILPAVWIVQTATCVLGCVLVRIAFRREG